MSKRLKSKSQETTEQVKHYTDQCTVRNAQGGMGKFNPDTFWPVYQKMGHSSLDFHRCVCNPDRMEA